MNPPFDDDRDELLGWLSRPDPRRGIRFAEPGGGWSLLTYDDLADRALRVAAALADRGLRPGARVALVAGNGPEFVAAFFGILAAGGTVSPAAPPSAFGARGRYRSHLAGVLGTLRPELALHDAAAGAGLAGPAADAGVPVQAVSALLAGPAAGGPDRSPADHDPAGPALVQFTSGSSGRVRGVRITYRALAANLLGIRRWLGMTAEGATASWLPVHHDMGLIGCLLAPVSAGSDIWLLSPGDFVRDPARYLSCFGERGARFSAMPGFGLDLVNRRVPPSRLAGMDFSGWRGLVVGAERIDPHALAHFTGLLAPAGLSPGAVLPAYGLAEATLAVTGVGPGEGWSVAHHAGAHTVGCGRPLAGVTVSVVDEAGQAVPDGTLGEIVVGGTTVGAGYLEPPPAEAADGGSRPDGTAFAGGSIRTGDAGFRHGGQLFVVGRFGDSLKVNGRAVFAEDLDDAVHGSGIPAGRCTVVLGHRSGTPTAMLVWHRPEPGWCEHAARVLRPLVGDAQVVHAVVPAADLARTSSGKPRRRQIWADHQAGASPDAPTDPADPRRVTEDVSEHLVL